MRMEQVRPILKRQYHAALAMLRGAIDRCTDDVWYAQVHKNACWQIAYHTLYFAHLYSMRDLDAFQPWIGQQPPTQNDDGIPGPPNADSPLPLMPAPYSREEVLAYCDFCDELIDRNIDEMDLGNPESGFWWYKIPKLEHQLVNIRHIQHGAAQLADRVRNEVGVGVDWVGSRERVPASL